VISSPRDVGDEHESSLEARTQAFLRDFFAKTESLVKDLIVENERLRMQVGDAASPQRESSGMGPATHQLVSKLMEQVEYLEQECTEIRRLAGSMEQESGGYRRRLERLESEHYHLAAMYVAGSQFHSAVTVEEVLRTITEILLNFVGVGRFTVYCVDEERQTLFPLMREGGETEQCPEIPLPPTGPLAEVTGAPGPWRVGRPRGEEDGVLMQLPLCSGTRLVGVARIESFLPQKHDFTEDDFGLLELVSEHAGIGIETAWIRVHAKDVPLSRGTLERLVVT
jgi:hypothetical protein